MLTGVAAGIGGMLVALLLHLVQHVAYDYSLGSLIGSESFLEGVSASSPARRFIVLLLCGFVAGIGWLAVYRFGRPLVSVSKAVNSIAARMPALTTAAHALLQTVTVAMGSPLGQEVAPREIGALLATNLSGRLRLGEEERRILIACGAGGGLAAVYNALLEPPYSSWKRFSARLGSPPCFQRLQHQLSPPVSPVWDWVITRSTPFRIL